MPRFSKQSIDRLEGVHPILIDLAFQVVTNHHDCKITYGLRSLAEQEKLVAEGFSRTINSKHLRQHDGTAWAIDMPPYPIDWKNTKRFYFFGGMVKSVFTEMQLNGRIPMQYQLIFGGDWDNDNDLDDQKFMDLVHFELRNAPT